MENVRIMFFKYAYVKASRVMSPQSAHIMFKMVVTSSEAVL